MLTIRENFLETIKGGKPERFVNQYEFMSMIQGNPYSKSNPRPVQGKGPVVDAWGVTKNFPANVPGPFPVHDDAHKVVRDITKWRDTVKAPNIEFPAADWQDAIDFAAKIDRSNTYATVSVAPGIFEHVHYLLSMEDALIAYYEEPEAMHELIDYLTAWEVRYAEIQCHYLKPNALFHHDDWGSHRSSFLSPAMFDEFILPAYEKIYGTYKANGVEIIVHHSDSYAANLVPSMIKMGIDVFQGCVTPNNVPDLVKRYGGQISFMGDIDNGVIDVPDWTPELIAREVERACRNNGKLYFIPCATMGGAMSTYPGVYDKVTEEIKRMSKLMF